jgi:hypothetical protein
MRTSPECGSRPAIDFNGRQQSEHLAATAIQTTVSTVLLIMHTLLDIHATHHRCEVPGPEAAQVPSAAGCHSRDTSDNEATVVHTHTGTWLCYAGLSEPN